MLTSNYDDNDGNDGDDNDGDDDDDDDNVCSSWHPMRKQEELWKHFATLFILINSLGSAPTPHFFSTSSYENPHAWEICSLFWEASTLIGSINQFDLNCLNFYQRL